MIGPKTPVFNTIMLITVFQDLKANIIKVATDHVSAHLYDIDKRPVLRNAKELNPAAWPPQMDREWIYHKRLDLKQYFLTIRSSSVITVNYF